MITGHQWALLYRAKCITEIPQRKPPKQICLVWCEIWGVGIIKRPKSRRKQAQSCYHSNSFATFPRRMLHHKINSRRCVSCAPAAVDLQFYFAKSARVIFFAMYCRILTASCPSTLPSCVTSALCLP